MTGAPGGGPGGQPLGRRFDEALVFASDLHRLQFRKETAIPYMAHLLAVAGLVLEQEGDEDEAIAALLHDAAEDQGGLPTLARIIWHFGEKVGSIVKACSDTLEAPKPPWQQRKEGYLQHLDRDDTVPSVLRVSLADKLHNLRAILRDYGQHGDDLWARFHADASHQLWYHRELARIFDRRLGGPFAAEFTGLVAQLAAIVEPAT